MKTKKLILKSLISFSKVPLPIVWFFVFVWVSTFALIGVDAHHDGLILFSAALVSEGKIPFSEVFTQYGLFMLLMQAGVLKIFGVKLVALKLLTSFFYSLIAIYLVKVWDSLGSRVLSRVSLLLWISMAPFYFWVLLPWASVYALLFQVLCVYFLINHVKQKKYFWLVLGGISSSLAFWCRMPVGVTLIITVFGYFLLIERNPKQILIYVASVVASSLPFFAFLAWTGSYAAWYDVTFDLARKFVSVNLNGNLEESFSGLIRRLVRIFFGLDYELLWALLPLTALYVFFTQFWKKPETRILKIQILIAMVAIGSWHQYFPITCYRHIFWAMSLSIGLFVLYAEKFSRFLFRIEAKRWGFLIILAIAVGGGLKNRLRETKNRFVQSHTFNRPDKPGPPALYGMIVPNQHFDDYALAYKAIHEAEKKGNKKFLNLTIDPLYLAFQQTPNYFHPLYVYYDIGLILYPNFPEKVAHYLANEHPVVISNGHVDSGKGYASIAELKNGITISEFNKEKSKIGPLLAGSKNSMFHYFVPNQGDTYEADLISIKQPGFRIEPMDFSKNFSIETIFLNDKNSGGGFLWSQFCPDSKSGLALRASPEDNNIFELVEYRNGFKPIMSFPLTRSAAQFQHIAVTKSGEIVKVFLNGEVQGTWKTQVIYSECKLPIVVGNLIYTYSRFHGTISEIIGYNDVLTDAEIKTRGQSIFDSNDKIFESLVNYDFNRPYR